MNHSAIVPRLLRVFHFTTGKPGAFCPVISPTILCMGREWLKDGCTFLPFIGDTVSVLSPRFPRSSYKKSRLALRRVVGFLFWVRMKLGNWRGKRERRREEKRDGGRGL